MAMMVEIIHIHGHVSAEKAMALTQKYEEMCAMYGSPLMVEEAAFAMVDILQNDREYGLEDEECSLRTFRDELIVAASNGFWNAIHNDPEAEAAIAAAYDE